MRVLIYRRTHIDDPCKHGIFGVCDCMGKFRNWKYDAVIGIGGESPDKGCEGIIRKLTWIGIAAQKSNLVVNRKTCQNTKKRFRGPLVKFKHFCLMNEDGPDLKDCAPKLAEHMFTDKQIPRAAVSKSRPDEIQKEISELLQKYKKCPPSEKCKCGQS